MWAARTVAPGGSLRARVGRLLAIKEEGEVTRALMQARCDRGAEIAYMLGLAPATAEAIRALDEHWDGRGQPRGLRGDEIPLLGAHPAASRRRWRSSSPRAAPTRPGRWPRRRRGAWFDPALVDALGAIRGDRGFWASLPDGDVSAWEPEDRVLMADETRLYRIAEAFAGVIDAKSPWTYRHSDRACVIVMSIAAVLGAGDEELGDLRRAALLHDVGKLAISNRILDKPGSLTDAEFATVRAHPLMTERILERVPGFRASGAARERAPRASRRPAAIRAA